MIPLWLKATTAVFRSFRSLTGIVLLSFLITVRAFEYRSMTRASREGFDSSFLRLCSSTGMNRDNPAQYLADSILRHCSSISCCVMIFFFTFSIISFTVFSGSPVESGMKVPAFRERGKSRETAIMPFRSRLSLNRISLFTGCPGELRLTVTPALLYCSETALPISLISSSLCTDPRVILDGKLITLSISSPGLLSFFRIMRRGTSLASW